MTSKIDDTLTPELEKQLADLEVALDLITVAATSLLEIAFLENSRQKFVAAFKEEIIKKELDRRNNEKTATAT